MRILLASVLLCAACGGESGPKHWSERPLETVSGTVGGVAFTIDVPKGMRMKAEPDQVTFDVLEDGRVYTPDITIRLEPKQTLEDSLKYEKDPNIVNKATEGESWVVSMENSYYKGKEDYVVRGQEPAGDKALSCNGRVTPWKKGEAVKDKVALVEKMCLSLTAK